MSLTRRAFIQSAGASAAAAGVALGSAGRALAGAGKAAGPNIVVIVIDSLRADHAYGDRARTPQVADTEAPARSHTILRCVLVP